MMRSSVQSIVLRVKSKNFELSKAVILGFALIFLIISFYLAPIPGGDDWTIFYETSRRVLSGQGLYAEPTSVTYFSNPPWLAVLLSPFGLLSLELSRAVFSVMTLVLALILAIRLQLGPVKLVFVLLSPPMIYILLHGQVDILVLAGLLLPQEWWLIVGLAKPQVAIGPIFGIKRNKFLRVLLVSAGVFLLTFLWFGNWPATLLKQPGQFIYEGHNIWRGFWPYQAIMGVFLILLALKRKDERFFVASSPFLSPYAATSSLIGPWLVGLTFLDNLAVGIIWVSWWAVIAYRFFA
jgi:hypothetical protein